MDKTIEPVMKSLAFLIQTGLCSLSIHGQKVQLAMRGIVDGPDSVEHAQHAEKRRMRRVTGDLENQCLIVTGQTDEPFV
jgi:hypothetical protein